MKKFNLVSYGQTIPVYFNIEEYVNSSSLALELIDDSNPKCHEPYAGVTVCLPASNLLENKATDAYIDTNNFPKVEDFLIKNNIAKPLGYSAMSGFCVYPAYRFNLEVIKD